MEDRITNKLIPALLRSNIVGDGERELRSLPTRYGRLAIWIIKYLSTIESANSKRITRELALEVNNQDLPYEVGTSNINKIKDEKSSFIKMF